MWDWLATPLLVFLGLFQSETTAYTRMVDYVSSSIVRITMDREHGYGVCTGFVVAPNRILTAAHCIGEKMYADGAFAKVLKQAPYYDLALLDAPTNKQPLHLRLTPVIRFETVTCIGYAFGWTRLAVLSDRVFLVDSLPNSATAPGLIMQIHTIGGMSGGPLVDANGLVIGITQQHNEGVGYGVGTLLIQAFLVGT